MRDGDSDEVFLKISEDCVDREVCEDEAGGDNRWFWREGKLKSLEPEIESQLATQNTLFSIYFNTEEQMNTENIFLDVDRWNQYSHPAKDLQNLHLKESPQQIKNYFLHKPATPPILRRISNRQLEKIQENVRSLKIKLIFKEKAGKLSQMRKRQEMNAAPSAKSSSKTNTCSEEDQQVSQYLNFEDQQEPQMLATE